jgi:uncharacterized protein YbjT (DUF2867 family)
VSAGLSIVFFGLLATRKWSVKRRSTYAARAVSRGARACTYTPQIVRSAWRAALASPSCLAASIRALEAWLKAMDISPLYFDDSKPHHAVSTAVIDSTMIKTVSRT